MQFQLCKESILLLTPLASLKRKIFMLPKNVTIVEVAEIGLERFGIQDSVADGGDEVEDKSQDDEEKWRSGTVWRPALREAVNLFYNNYLTFYLYMTSITPTEKELVQSTYWT